MVERINLLLKAKNITARQFAEEIGIQPSGMSHILSGRNNPSLDFVMKVIRRWPEVNINWLMFGKGEMFAALPIGVQPAEPIKVANDSVQSSETSELDLFSQPEMPMVEPVGAPKSAAPVDVPEVAAVDSVEQSVVVTLGQSVVVDKPIVSSASVDPSSDSLVKPQPSDVVENKIDDHLSPKPNENRINEAPLNGDPVQPILVNQTNLHATSKRIMKIVILYDDHSFSEYYPE